MHFIWNNTGVRVAQLVPDTYQLPLGAVVVIGVLLIGGFASPESADNTRDVLVTNILLVRHKLTVSRIELYHCSDWL